MFSSECILMGTLVDETRRGSVIKLMCAWRVRRADGSNRVCWQTKILRLSVDQHRMSQSTAEPLQPQSAERELSEHNRSIDVAYPDELKLRNYPSYVKWLATAVTIITGILLIYHTLPYPHTQIYTQRYIHTLPYEHTHTKRYME